MVFYLDTSVFGGILDKEFRKDTLSLFEYMSDKPVTVLYSDINVKELQKAPVRVKELFKAIRVVRRISIEQEVLSLANLYIELSPEYLKTVSMRFYLDTSVFGGYYDPEFSADTQGLFNELAKSSIKVVYSFLTERELQKAPSRVSELLDLIPNQNLELVSMSEEALQLAAAYIQQGALSRKYEDDAQHIALATIHRVDSLISWNFRHMVNFFRIRAYNSVNLKLGYTTIDIRTPKEVIK